MVTPTVPGADQATGVDLHGQPAPVDAHVAAAMALVAADRPDPDDRD